MPPILSIGAIKAGMAEKQTQKENEVNIQWVIGSMWCGGDGPWAPGVSVSSAPKDFDRQTLVADFLRFQRHLHPNRRFSGSFFVCPLDELTQGDPHAKP